MGDSGLFLYGGSDLAGIFSQLFDDGLRCPWPLRPLRNFVEYR